MTTAQRIPAIPTLYAGVQFRSRLEARWAALFDLAEWPWSYEPTDLDGWIPDFLLMGKSDILCEVKPIRSILEDLETVQKIWRAIRGPTPSEVLLLGLEGAAWLREAHHLVPEIAPGTLDPWRVGWGEACIGRVDGKLDVWHYWGSPEARIHGGGLAPRLEARELAQLWREAGNKVQWRRP